jgi:hypothetical protein
MYAGAEDLVLEAPASDEIQASVGARAAPASLLHPWNRGTPSLPRSMSVPAPDGTLSDERRWARPSSTGDLSRVRQQRSPHPVTCCGASFGGRDAGRANAPECQSGHVFLHEMPANRRFLVTVQSWAT